MCAAELLDAASHAPSSPAAVPRRLVVTWQHPTRRSICPVAVLTFDGSTYDFRYIRAALTVDEFTPLIGFPDFRRAYQAQELFPLFAQRAMDPRRDDFARYVTRLGLPEDSTPWEQIARSGGKRVGDTLQLFPQPQVVNGRMACAFLVHGLRHITENELRPAGGPLFVTAEQVETALRELSDGDELEIVAEAGNTFNRNALLIAASGTPVGWIPNLLVDDLARLPNDANLRAYVERINGPDAPGHLRLLGRLVGERLGDFSFFTSSEWEPLA